MRYFDLHCDTLVACLDQNKSLIDNDLHVSVKKGDRFAPYVQCAAVWLPDSVRGAAALQYFDRHAAYFRKMAETGAFTVLETGEDLEKLGNKQGTAFILTVEGGSAVAGDLKNIHHLRENGVRVMTLTWNGSNEIGSGVMSGDKFGLTPFGKLAVKEMEKEGIVIDTRNNGGGRLHEDIEILFSGNKYLDQVVRGVVACEMPSRRYNKPSIMIVCEANYSNAHGAPWVYRGRGIGSIVGMPVPGTMTSVNWETLQDASMYFGIPVVGYRTKDGKYLENTQLEPDLKVRNDYDQVIDGRDQQLEVAVKELLRQIDARRK